MTSNPPRPAVVLAAVFGILLLVILLIFSGLLPPVAGLAAVGLLVVSIFWFIRENLAPILLVFAGVLFLSVVVTHRAPKLRPDRIAADEGDALAKKWAVSGKFNDKLPIVVHLIFDEMMSPGAMTPELPGGAATRQSVLELGQKHGLRIYDSVYSRFFFSGISIPNMMNAEYTAHTKLAEMTLVQSGEHTANAYFDDMARRGYRTVVFQSALMNFCTNKNVDMCQTLDSFDPGAGDTGLDARNQRASLWQTFVRAYEPSFMSQLGRALLHRAYGLRTDQVGVMGTADRYDAQRFPAWFDRFTRFAVTVPRGTHIFAHFMAPHSPYLLSERCVVSGQFEGGYYLANYPKAEREARRRHYYEGYFAQFRCVERKLDDFLSAIEGLETYKDATIIIHGDHGSRISSGNVLEEYTPRDFIDNYAAFYAVKSPAAPAGVDCEFVSLPEIFRRTVAVPPPPPRTGPPLPVIVKGNAENEKRVEAPMPRFGCAAATLNP
ncbi:MAG TPA: sulfatase-like hydrolase/transferase [Thermoanaerobaculia bacterium]|nr:sulfatase-like hydrolase/transferase [Thermoanaerobaculia bacterium]